MYATFYAWNSIAGINYQEDTKKKKDRNAAACPELSNHEVCRDYILLNYILLRPSKRTIERHPE
jgi:hypothetical protein